MSTSTSTEPVVTRTSASPGFGSVVRAEWIKLATIRSTWWIVGLTVVAGVGFTYLIALDASSGNTGESAESFITSGVQISQIFAVVLGALVVTNEYGSGMVHSSFTAVPKRGRVMAAKAVVAVPVMFVLGTATALIGYALTNPMYEDAGLGMALEGDVLRAMYGSGLYLAGSVLFAIGLGYILRHTAGAIAVGLGLMLIVSNLVQAIPGDTGEWIAKLTPGNASLVVSTPEPFNPNLLDAWPGFGVFMAETVVVLLVAWVMLRRRDA